MAGTSQRISLLSLVVLLFIGCSQQQDPNAPAAAAESAVLPSTENSKDFGEYIVHFNALTTEELTPEVARQYGIVRSKSRAMLNVTVLKKNESGLGEPVPGSVSATAINLTGQLKNLAFREIREGPAIYYISELAVADGETLIFSIDVTPINEPSRFSVRYKRQFFVD
jgi:Domain of unknown function (DUF4426)